MKPTQDIPNTKVKLLDRKIILIAAFGSLCAFLFALFGDPQLFWTLFNKQTVEHVHDGRVEQSLDPVLASYHVSTFLACQEETDVNQIQSSLDSVVVQDISHHDVTLFLGKDSAWKVTALQRTVEFLAHYDVESSEALDLIFQSVHRLTISDKTHLALVLSACQTLPDRDVVANAIRKYHRSPFPSSFVYLTTENAAPLSPFDTLFQKRSMFSNSILGPINTLTDTLLAPYFGYSWNEKCEGVNRLPYYLSSQGFHGLSYPVEYIHAGKEATVDCSISIPELDPSDTTTLKSVLAFKRKWQPSMSLIGFLCDLKEKKWVTDALHSIKDQIYSDFEVILIDNGCNKDAETAWEALHSLRQDLDQNSNLLRLSHDGHSENSINVRYVSYADEHALSYLAAFIKAASTAKSDLIAFWNAKDTLSPNAVEKLYWHSRTLLGRREEKSVGFIYPSYVDFGAEQRFNFPEYSIKALENGDFNPALFVTSKRILQEFFASEISPDVSIWKVFALHGYGGQLVAENVMSRRVFDGIPYRVPLGPFQLQSDVESQNEVSYFDPPYPVLDQLRNTTVKRVLYMVNTNLPDGNKEAYDAKVLETLRNHDHFHGAFISLVILASPIKEAAQNHRLSVFANETHFLTPSEDFNLLNDYTHTEAFLDYIFETRAVTTVFNSQASSAYAVVKKWATDTRFAASPRFERTPLKTVHVVYSAQYTFDGDIEFSNDLLATNAEEYVFSSFVLKDHFIGARKVLGFPHINEAIVIPPCITAKSLYPERENTHRPPENIDRSPTALFVGSLESENEPLLFLQALNYIQTIYHNDELIKSIMIGTGALMNDVEAYIIGSQLKGIKLSSSPYERQIRRVLELNPSSVLVVPPSLVDRIPFAVMDAMVLGVPVVAFDCGSVKETLLRATGMNEGHWKDESITVNGEIIPLKKHDSLGVRIQFSCDLTDLSRDMEFQKKVRSVLGEAIRMYFEKRLGHVHRGNDAHNQAGDRAPNHMRLGLPNAKDFYEHQRAVAMSHQMQNTRYTELMGRAMQFGYHQFELRWKPVLSRL